ncbi:LysE family transporter [Photobacterium indicum]|uniref:LysE family transporter n=1 Tax=Photobacterium indicum TaxID=81447 RepID=UPI003D09A6F8
MSVISRLALRNRWGRIIITIHEYQREPQINQIMLLGSTMLVVDTVVMIGYSLLATRLAHLIKNERHVRIQNRIFGSMFMGAGSLLAVASHN